MSNLKLSSIPDDKSIKVTVELPAEVHRDLTDYAKVLGRRIGRNLEPKRLIGPMLAHFMATDRAFTSSRRALPRQSGAELAQTANKPSYDQ